MHELEWFFACRTASRLLWDGQATPRDVGARERIIWSALVRNAIGIVDQRLQNSVEEEMDLVLLRWAPPTPEAHLQEANRIVQDEFL